ncbi:MAG: choice-of-anchor D domain-containing protein [Planctomycetes bacterium]|nr:choice-of-anchor D domain-containing protein [Planctomycetota bacterium]
MPRTGETFARLTILALAICLFLGGGGVPVSPPAVTPGGPSTPGDHKPGEVLIKFRPSAGAAERDDVRSGLGASRARRFRSGAEHWKLGAGLSTEEAIARLRAHPRVEYAEPNSIVRADLLPDDPRFPELWGLRNTGQNGGTPGADIHAEMAWNVSTGSRTVRVAVIDTGIDYTHPDLAANIWANPDEIPANGIDDDHNGFVDDLRGWDFVNDDNDPRDDMGHGTHVAGTIGAVGDNGTGVAGVDWQVSLVPVKFLDAGGSGTTADAVAAVDYAAALGVDVMNASWGSTEDSRALYDAIAGGGGSLFVAAAGNDALDNDAVPHFPSNYDLPNVIAVAATDRHDLKADFSDWGATTVDLGAPGVDILSTIPGGGYGLASGTSMAAPHVSGVAALVRAAAPGIEIAQMRQRLLDSVDPIPALSGITVSGGRLNAFLPIAEPDSVPPGAIGDLSAGSPASNSIVLAWTATGDDEDVGTAASYDLRYSTAIIDDTGFASAPRVNGVPAPGPAGAAERFEVRGLLPDTVYYFAIKAKDEWGNAGPISNLASGRTLPPPTLATSPASFSVALLSGQTATRTLTIENAGEGTLDWRIPFFEAGSRTQSQPFEALSLAKGAADPRVGAPVVDGRGGPDGFGYTFMDSDEPDGPAFVWTDIAATGTPIPDLYDDDQTSSSIPIGFGMPFYGNVFDSVRVSTNGFLSFTSSLADFNNQPLPSPGAPENLIAPFWDDLHFRGAHAAVYVADGSRFTVQFTGVERYEGPGDYTFQVTLFASGEIVLRYLAMTGDTTSSTVGIQNGSGTVGLNVAFNTDYVHDGLAVRIAPPARWISAAPTEGRLFAGERQDVTITFDARGLEAGLHEGTLYVESNDPLRPRVGHSIGLDVTGAPAIAVQPASLDFGTVFAGFARTRDLAVSNIGTDPLTIGSIVSGDPVVTAAPSSLTLPPRGSGTVAVTYAPGAPGSLNTVLTISNDSSNAPTLLVSVTGSSAPAPEIGVDPSSYSETLLTGGVVTRRLTIANAGGSDLVVRVTGELAANAPASTPSLQASTIAARFPHAGDTQDAPPPRPAAPYPPATGSSTGQDESDGPIRGPNSVGRPAGTIVALALPAPEIVNGGFETGNFTGWTARSNGRGELIPWTVTGPGGGWWLNSSPAEGAYDALNGFDGEAGLEYTLSQDFTIPFGTIQAVLTFADRIQFDSLGIGSSLPRIYEATLLDQSGSTLATLAREEIRLDGRPYTDLGWRQRSADLTPFAGQTVRLQIRESIPESYTGPATIEFDSFGITATVLPEWLKVSPPDATVGPGESRAFDVTFDADSLDATTLQGAVRIETNIPDLPPLRVPATLTVVGAPNIVVSPDRLDFGTVYVGQAKSLELTVLNQGPEPLEVARIESDLPEFVPSPGSLSLPARGSGRVAVTFTPASAGAFAAGLRLESDDPDTPVLSLGLSGAAIEPPIVGVAPPALSATVFEGGSQTQILTLSNTGASPLDFSLHVSPVSVDSGAEASCDLSTVLVNEWASGQLSAVDMNTGEVRTIASSLRGPNKGLVPSDDLATAFIAESNRAAITAVDLSTGATAIVSSNVGAPNGLVFDPSRTTAYVTDYGFGRLLALDLSSGNVRTIISGLSAPNGLTLGGAGTTAFVTDYDARRLLMVDLASSAASVVASGLGGPVDVVLDPTETSAFVTAYDSGQVLKVDLATGAVSVTASGLSNPSGLKRHGTTLVVAEAGTGRLSTIDLAGGSVTPVASGLSQPTGVALLLPGGCLRGFLNLTPSSGSIAPGGSVEVQALFDSESLPGGVYQSTIEVVSNDPVTPIVQVPASLTVVASPDITLDTDRLDFGTIFVGQSRDLSLTIRNSGSDWLEVGPVTADRPEFTSFPPTLSIAPRGAAALTVSFAPGTAGPAAATLTITSNDRDEGEVAVALSGVGLVPPVIGVTPASLSESLFTGETASRTLTIQNTGGSDLTWEISLDFASGARVVGTSPTFTSSLAATGSKEAGTSPSDPPGPGGVHVMEGLDDPDGTATVQQGGGRPLEEVLAALNASFASVTGAIPNRFDFSEGETGTYINDGGNDMYDGGNFLGTNLGGPIPYSNDLIVGSAPFGPGGRHFTRKYPGLFVLAADMQGVDAFTISGNLGADGSGSVDGVVLETRVQGVAYRGFVKRVYNAFDPSVNHLVIVAADPVIAQEFSTNTNDDYHRVYGLSGASRIYYLLYAGAGGSFIGNEATLGIMEAFLATLPPEWLGVTPAAGAVPAQGSAEVTVAFDATGLNGGDYDAAIVVRSNDPVRPEVAVPALLHVTGVPDIAVSETALEFGTLFVGASRELSFTVENRGTDVLDVRSIASDAGAFVPLIGSLTLAVGGRATVTVTFTPASAETFSGTLSLVSNDPDTPDVGIALAGVGVEPPVIGVDPAALAATLLTGTQEIQSLTISNAGPAPLEFSLSVDTRPSGGGGPGAAATCTPATALVNEFNSGELSVVDLASGAATRIAAGLGGPNRGLALNQAMTLAYVAESSVGEFSVVDVATGSVTRIASGLNFPSGVAVTRDGSTAFVTEQTTGTLLRVNLSTGAVTQVVASLGLPVQVVLNAAETKAYVAEFSSGRLTAVDLAARTTTPIAVGLARASGVALNALETTAYVTELDSGRLAAVDLATGSITRLASGLSGPMGLDVDPSGTTAWVTEYDSGELSAINLSNGVITRVTSGLSGPTGALLTIPAACRAGYLSVDPVSGVVEPFGSTDVTVRFNAAGLAGGRYEADIVVASNDPVRPKVTIPATLTVVVDSDDDGVLDPDDNCPLVPNTGQEDLDGDRLGDSCDNCPAVSNPGQEDADQDAIGDGCDSCMDTDHDGFGDPGFPQNSCPPDNCPAIPNPQQADFDGDGIGDACDLCTDADHDGFGNPGFPRNTCGPDNCPGVANPDQRDADGDSVGDACDPCTDRDRDGFGDPGFPASACALDNCPLINNPFQTDTDGDGIGDACDSCTDSDGDGFGDPAGPINTCAPDNCPAMANPDQADEDGDGIGDACDSCPRDPRNDADGDGACGDADNCPAANPDQLDVDADGVGDACDNCPAAANPDQADSNLDGSGDACQPTLVLLDIRQRDGATVEVVTQATDPQNDPLSGTLDFLTMVAQPITLPDVLVTNDCGLGYLPEGVPGEGIGFVNGSVGVPLLFDLDTYLGCSDFYTDYVMAPGTCDNPQGPFDTLIDLSSVTTPAAMCVRRYGSDQGGRDLTILSFDDSTLLASTPQIASVLRLPFDPGLPGPVDITSLQPGQTYRLVITVTDGATLPVTAEGGFVHQGESRLVIVPPNRPPRAAITGATGVVECTAPSGGPVTLDASASTDPDSTPGTNDDIVSYLWVLDPGQPSEEILGAGAVLNLTLPLGEHAVGLRVTDSEGATDGAETVIAVRDSTSPALTCPAAVTEECAGPEGAPVGLMATASDACGGVTIVSSRSGGADASGTYPLGSTPVTFTATDASGNVATCATSVTVRDTTPPAVMLTIDPVVLWPPNHRLVPVGAAWQVSDQCDPSATVRLAGVTSSEPDDAPGDGDGRTTEDIADAETGAPDADILLRAERAGTGPGRTYELTYGATDASGNPASALAVVRVPRDLGEGPEPVLIRLQPNGTPGMVRLDWNAVPGGEWYDVISGDVAVLAADSKRITLGAVRVPARGLADISWGEAAGAPVPAAGKATFYLVQYRNGGVISGYGTESVPLPREPVSCEGGCPPLEEGP